MFCFSVWVGLCSSVLLILWALFGCEKVLQKLSKDLQGFRKQLLGTCTHASLLPFSYPTPRPNVRYMSGLFYSSNHWPCKLVSAC